MSVRLLVICDEGDHGAELSADLENQGYEVETAADKDSAYGMIESYGPDLLLVDLSKINGGIVYREISERTAKPFIVISSRKDANDVARGLNFGADDYVVKPYNVIELSARIVAVLRRFKSSERPAVKNVLRFDNMEINMDEYVLKIKGKKVKIPPKELELIYILAANHDRVFTRNELLDKIWSYDFVGGSRTVDVHIKRLREKLAGVSDKWELKTVWSVGYKFELSE